MKTSFHTASGTQKGSRLSSTLALDLHDPIQGVVTELNGILDRSSSTYAAEYGEEKAGWLVENCPRPYIQEG